MILLQRRGNLICSAAIQRHLINAPNDSCSFFIDNPVLGILWVFQITVRRLRQRLAGGSANFVA